jgi:hypothetical protein
LKHEDLKRPQPRSWVEFNRGVNFSEKSCRWNTREKD